MQEIIIVFLFLAAIAYLAFSFKKDFNKENACSSNCGACNSIDLEKAAREIEQRMKQESLS